MADLDANKNALRYFIPGPAIDERVAQIEANGVITFMHTDRQSSVVAISDSAGNVSAQNRRGYGTYGETNPAQMTGTGSHPFGYTGRRWDNDLGLYYYRARWYDPALGTFLQTDPIGDEDYINLYAYVGVEPTNGTDPSGERVRPVQPPPITRAPDIRQSGTPISARLNPHVVQRHVSQTPQFLANRLRNERVPAASTFTSVRGAQGAIDQVISVNAPQIRSWLRVAPIGRTLTIESPRGVCLTSTNGIVMVRTGREGTVASGGLGTIRQATGTEVTIVRTSQSTGNPHGFVVLTAFPTAH